MVFYEVQVDKQRLDICIPYSGTAMLSLVITVTLELFSVPDYILFHLFTHPPPLRHHRAGLCFYESVSVWFGLFICFAFLDSTNK